MTHKRRGLLRLISAGVGFGASGSTHSGRVRESMPESDVALQQATESEAGAVPELSGRTDDVMDELSWFATEYDDAVENFRRAAGAVLTEISGHGEAIQLTDTAVDRLDGRTDRPRFDRGWPYDIWWEKGERRWRYADIDWQRPTDAVSDETPIRASAVDDLRTVTEEFATTFKTNFDPHFSGASRKKRFATEMLDTIERFNDRGDIAMVVAGLVRLYERYEALSSDTYIEGSLSEAPIRNRLAEYLESTVSTSTTPLFEVEYRSDSDGGDTHLAFVYDDSVDPDRRDELYDSEPLATIDGSTGDTRGMRLQDVVGELSVDTNRIDHCYVLVNEWSRPSANYYSEELTSQPIFVQRYESATAASEAYDQLLDHEDITPAMENVRLGEPGTEPWTGLYFPYESQPWSAAVRRTGRHLFVAGVARRPLQHRRQDIGDGDWTDPLRLAWIWTGSE